MIELIDRIKQEASLLEFTPDSIALDKALGAIESLIHAARLEIDDEWRELRAQVRPPKGVIMMEINPEEIHELLKDIL